MGCGGSKAAKASSPEQQPAPGSQTLLKEGAATEKGKPEAPAADTKDAAVTGTQDTTKSPAAKTNSVMRLVSYKCQAGSEAEWQQLMDTIAPQLGQAEGLMRADWTWTDPQTCSLAMQFSSQELLDKYRAGMRENFLEQMKPLMAGPPAYDCTGPLMGSYEDGSVILEADKGVMRLFSYKCKEGKESEFTSLLGELMVDFQKEDVSGLVWINYSLTDPRTAVFQQVMSSQEKLDAYRAGVREKYLERLGPLLEGGPVYDECGPLKSVLLIPAVTAPAEQSSPQLQQGSQQLGQPTLEQPPPSVDPTAAELPMPAAEAGAQPTATEQPTMEAPADQAATSADIVDVAVAKDAPPATCCTSFCGATEAKGEIAVPKE